MNTSYIEILSADPQDLYPETFTESYYSIPFEPNQLLKVLELLRENNEMEIHSNIITPLQEEYNLFS